MAKVFLDANLVIDFLERKQREVRSALTAQSIYVTPLSIHIFLYINRKKVPYSSLSEIKKYFLVVPFEEPIMYKALTGPTSDFEDNVHLHSAASAECEYFLTSDRELLDMKFFGKTKIIAPGELQ